MSDIRVDLDTASREDLVAEIIRLHGVCETWATSWRTIVNANTEAWVDQVEEARRWEKTWRDIATRRSDENNPKKKA